MSLVKNLIVIGAGGHAGSVADAARSAGFTIVGFFDGSAGRTAGEREALDSLDGVDLEATGFALGIGANYSREDSYATIKNSYPGARFPVIVHSSAWVSPSANLAEGAVVMSMASIGPGCSVGLGSLVNTGSSIDHDSKIGSFASLGPGARTGGNVTIGERTVVGLNAGILQGISVGSDTVIGAHSLVNKAMLDSVVAYGTPATVVRQRQREEPYY
jgi:sugar O-acyltransferase (sialic acid O-acetyltransferase NeuD family)